MKLDGVTPAASGYRSLGVLNSPVFAKSLVTRFYCQSVTGQVTDQSIVPSELKDCGDTVIFRRDPKPELFDYIKNQDLEVSELNTEPISMTINRAKYWNLKIDQVDEKQICNIKTYVDAFLKNTTLELAQRIDREVLQHIPVAADCYNKGANAGKRSRAYNLGYATQPLTFTAQNLMEIIGHAAGVLAEQCATGSDSYIVLPLEAKTLFYQNPILQNSCTSGLSQSIVLNGSIPSSLFGSLNIYFSTNLQRHQEANGKIAYSIPFGHKSATGFVTQLTKQRMIDSDVRSFSKYWQGLSLYDFKTIRPELVGAIYATIQI